MKQRYWYFDLEESLVNYSLDFIHFPFRKKNQEAILQRRKQSFWDWKDQELGKKILIP